jgi:protein TonB
MLRNRHFISYFSTTLIYLSLAGLFFYVQEHQFVSAEKIELQTINMTLSTFVPEVIPPVEEVEEKIIEEEIVEEEPLVEPEIIEEPVVEEEVIPEPIIEKVIPKPIIKKKPKPKVKKSIKKKVKKKTVKKKRVKKTVSSAQSKSSSAKKNKFLARVRAKINKHKSYPRIAKKRGMQGSIKVKFTILRSGKVGHISVDGPKVFRNSARGAVKSAFPINAKKAPISLPMSVNITLRYQIR